MAMKRQEMAPVPMQSEASWMSPITQQLRASQPWSKSSPSGLDVPVRRACFPSQLSRVEYAQMHAAKLPGGVSGGRAGRVRVVEERGEGRGQVGAVHHDEQQGEEHQHKAY